VTVQVFVVLTAVTVYDVGVPPEDPAATVTVTLPSPAAPVGAAGVPGADTVNDDVAAVNVNMAVPVCVPWVAVTAHLPAAVAVSDVPVTTQSVPVVA
jgi:hypothetical protein